MITVALVMLGVCAAACLAAAVIGGICAGALAVNAVRGRTGPGQAGDDTAAMLCYRCDGSPEFACTCISPCGRRGCPEARAEYILSRTDLTGELAALLGEDQ